MLAISWTLGLNQRTDPYHIAVIKSHLTRNLGNLFSDLREEIVLAFGDIIPPTEGTFLTVKIFLYFIVLEPFQFGDIDSPCRPADWTKVKAYEAVMNVVGRASNRIFVGAPLCMFVCRLSRATIDVAVRPRSRAPCKQYRIHLQCGK
jgi:hypothetical protein